MVPELRLAEAATMLRLVVSVLLLGTSCSRSERLGLTTFGEDCLGKTEFIYLEKLFFVKRSCGHDSTC
jgi:hypothetical protein